MSNIKPSLSKTSANKNYNFKSKFDKKIQAWIKNTMLLFMTKNAIFLPNLKSFK